MGGHDDLIERLDQVIALLKLGFSGQLEALQAELREDPVALGILDSLRNGPMASGELKRSVSQSANVSEKTVQRSMSELVGRGLLLAKGGGRSITYQLSGVI